jgi:Transposase DDE domain group 1
VNGTSVSHVIVEPGGTGVVAHVGLHALGSFADRLGLGDSLSARIPLTGERLPVHDRGKVLVHAALMLAGGGESCADIEHLRLQSDLFGSVPSDSTVFRTFHEITATTRDEIAEAMAQMRSTVWARSARTTGKGPVILDIDASLVEIHTDTKENAGPTYKGGFGFHPMFCFADATGETLAGLLRPGNAGANTVADHVRVLDQAIAQLPDALARGHQVGAGSEVPTRQVVVRADSAGCTEGFLSACRARNVTFFVSARSNPQVTSAIFDAVGLESVWEPAITQQGDVRVGTSVCELTSLLDNDALPDGTRLIVRREPLHPGAQRSLFPSLDFRYWGFYTDAEGSPVELDATMRAHAHVEQHIGRLKDAGLSRMPFTSFEANANWMMTVAMSADLVRWFQLLCFDGRWVDARPKAMRWGILHAPGRLIHRSRQRVVRIIEGWPGTDALVEAYRRIALLT